MNVSFDDSDWLIQCRNHPMAMDLMNDDLMFENYNDNSKEDVHKMNALLEICLSQKTKERTSFRRKIFSDHRCSILV